MGSCCSKTILDWPPHAPVIPKVIKTFHKEGPICRESPPLLAPCSPKIGYTIRYSVRVIQERDFVKQMSQIPNSVIPVLIISKSIWPQKHKCTTIEPPVFQEESLSTENNSLSDTTPKHRKATGCLFPKERDPSRLDREQIPINNFIVKLDHRRTASVGRVIKTKLTKVRRPSLDRCCVFHEESRLCTFSRRLSHSCLQGLLS